MLTQAIDTIPFVAGVFLGDRMREVLKEEGVGYLDLAGNFYLNRGDFYVEKIVDKNPFSRTPPLKNLFAPISSRVTRAMLIEPKRTWHLSELAQETGVSLGQSSSVTEKMIAQEFLFWNAKGKIELKNPTPLLEAWKKVYSHSAHPLPPHPVNNTPTSTIPTKQPTATLTFPNSHVINDSYQVYSQITKSLDRKSNSAMLRTESRQLLRNLHVNTLRKRTSSCQKKSYSRD